jgi:hypothetical protein
MLLSAETVDGLVHQLGGTRLRAECSLVPPLRGVRRGAPSPPPPTSVDGEICPVGYAVATSPGDDGLRRHYDAIIHATPPFYDHPPPPVPDRDGGGGWAATDVPTDDDEDARRARSRTLLGSCYRRSFELAFGHVDDAPSSARRDLCGWARDSLRGALVGLGRPRAVGGGAGGRRVAVPLLGSGCRAFPKDVASDVAASEAASWLLSRRGDDAGVGRRAGTADEDGDGCEGSVVVFGLLERDDAEDLSAKLKRLLSD